jgi:hypothetical protein
MGDHFLIPLSSFKGCSPVSSLLGSTRRNRPQLLAKLIDEILKTSRLPMNASLWVEPARDRGHHVQPIPRTTMVSHQRIQSLFGAAGSAYADDLKG